MKSNLRDLASRSRGVFLGAAAGDALGWPQEQNSGLVGGHRNREVEPRPEFRDWIRYNGGQYHRYVDPVGAGQYSDDTQLILATARAIQTNDWFATFTGTELPTFLLYQRGAGGATLRSCRSWAGGHAPWIGGSSQKVKRAQERYFSAGGNGVAMRVAPHAIACAGRPRSELVARVLTDGIATHGHPRALVGAAVYAVALHLLLTMNGTLEYGELIDEVSADDSWQQPDIASQVLPKTWFDALLQLENDVSGWWGSAVSETRELLTVTQQAMKSGTLGNDGDVLASLGCFDKRVNGAGTISSVGAIYLASRNAPRPMSGLVRAAFLMNADSDTLASMTGGLLGALHGTDWCGQLASSVQDRSYLEEMADSCTSLALGENRYQPTPQPVRDRDLTEFRNALIHGNVRTLPDGRDITDIQVRELESRTKAQARRWIVLTDSQTMMIDSVERASGSGQELVVAGASGEAPKRTPAVLQRISLLATDLDAIENFYGVNGLGLTTRRMSRDEVYVGKVLRFVFIQDATDFQGPPTLLEIEVANLNQIVESLGVTLVGTHAARVKDPAGNEVWISQAQQ